MPAGEVLVVCLWGQGMPRYALLVISGVEGTPQYLHELFEGSWDTQYPNEFALRPVGGPYTSLSWSLGQRTPPYPH